MTALARDNVRHHSIFAQLPVEMLRHLARGTLGNCAADFDVLCRKHQFATVFCPIEKREVYPVSQFPLTVQRIIDLASRQEFPLDGDAPTPLRIGHPLTSAIVLHHLQIDCLPKTLLAIKALAAEQAWPTLPWRVHGLYRFETLFLPAPVRWAFEVRLQQYYQEPLGQPYSYYVEGDGAFVPSPVQP